MKNFLDFEKDIKELEDKIDHLKSPYGSEGISEVDTQKIHETQEQINEKLKETYANLKSWQKTASFRLLTACRQSLCQRLKRSSNRK